MKHAYLIMAHCNFLQLKKLIRAIDDPRNDIYIHIDAKVKDAEYIKNELYKELRSSTLYFANSVSVFWGDFSQILAELSLLNCIKDIHEYRYYHLISGMDLPLKSQNYIHNFFEENNGYEFIDFSDENYVAEIINRFRYYWILQSKIGNGKSRGTLIYKLIRKIFLVIQKFLRVDRTKYLGKDNRYAAGSQWFSITDEFAEYILKNKKDIRKKYSFTVCSDELFLQNLAINSEFADRCYKLMDDSGHKGNNLRIIDWERGNPYVWRESDYQELVSTDALFARKFDENMDERIIDKIIDFTKREKNNERI